MFACGVFDVPQTNNYKTLMAKEETNAAKRGVEGAAPYERKAKPKGIYRRENLIVATSSSTTFGGPALAKSVQSSLEKAIR